MLSINTNLSSLIAQNSMKTSSFKLDTAIERMTTGYKINHAKDNAANYSISTNMTTKIGAYMVAEDNALQGLDMINTASENLSLIEDKLIRLRALATQASNGTYGTQSLEAINAEAGALVDELGRTYSTAEYNGVKVFKGTVKIEIPDGVGTTGNVGVQTASTYSMRATNYGNFIDDPKNPNGDEYVDGLTSVSAAVTAGSLTSGGEYKVGTVQDLKALATYVNGGNDTTGMTFIMSEDIDLSGEANWTPIGDYATNSSYQFKGTFDGNGHVIKNLTINRSKDYQGLFGYIASGSEIKNVGIEGGSVKGERLAGGIVGQSTSTISNCYATCNVTGTHYAGGLVGLSYSSISNCYATGNVTSQGGRVGGLVGEANRLLTNCYATGDVRGEDSYVGGLAGNSEEIINSYAIGNVTGTDCVGGLVGSASKVTNCYATGNVTGLSNNVGGLIGTITFDVINCYATGNVTGNKWVGGLIGNAGSHIEISCTYATGNVSGTTNVGGLVGKLDPYNTSNAPVNNSYTTGNVSGDSFVGGIAGLVNPRQKVTITDCLSYSTVNGSDSDSTGGLIGGAIVTTNNSTFKTINITGCQALSSNNNLIGGSYMYASSTYTLLSGYDMSAMTAGISLYKAPITSMTLQVGANAPDSNQITFDMAFELDGFNSLSQIGIDTTTDFTGMVDSLLSIVSAKQTEYGAVQNRLESALDEIATQYENLVSSRSTIRDADMSEVSSEYIRQQILQQASATLMSTANQSPAIALQLI